MEDAFPPSTAATVPLPVEAVRFGFVDDLLLLPLVHVLGRPAQARARA